MKAAVPGERRYRPLEHDSVRKIVGAALDVLQSTGFSNSTTAVLEPALASGCRLDDDGRLLFPHSLVEDVVANAAREFVLFGQDANRDVEIRPGVVRFATGGAAVKMLDAATGRYRPSTVRDLYDLARIADLLPEIDWFTRPVVATEAVDARSLDINTVYACAAGTTKHIGASISAPENVADVVDLLAAVRGCSSSAAMRPFLTVHATTVVSPLSFAQDSSDTATRAALAGLPILSLTGPQAGATAPAALAGTLVQATAETLGAIVAINLVRPGHPVIAGGWPFVSDLRTGAFSGGAPEQALLSSGMAQILDYLELPSGVPAAMTDSKLPDNQSGYEKGVSAALTAASGPSFIYETAGMTASLLGCSFEALVIDAEMLSTIRRILNGITVSEDMLAVEQIDQVVRGPGHFLGQGQTLELMKTEFLYPDLADRASILDWEDKGQCGILEGARVRVEEILSGHFPRHVPDAVDADIRNRYPILLDRKDMLPASGPEGRSTRLP